MDRGFRDSVDTMESLGLNVVLSPFLNGRRQFTTSEVVNNITLGTEISLQLFSIHICLLCFTKAFIS